MAPLRALAPIAMSPPVARARLAAALVLSLALHAATLALLSSPRGWDPAFDRSYAAAGPLRARLRGDSPAETPPPTGAHPEAAPAAPEPAEGRASDPSPGEPPRSLGAFLGRPHYYPAGELERKPQILDQVEPRFPPGATAETGRVVLRLYIGEKGNVEEIVVMKAEPDASFGTAAAEAFAAARFLPGMKSGAPVRSLLLIEALFGVPPAADAASTPPQHGPPQAPRARPPRHRAPTSS
jgi:TonB family protein